MGENVPDARIWGFELEGSQSWGQGVITGIDYSYTNSRDLDSGLVLPRRPHHQGRAYCEWQLSAVPLTLGSELVYRGSHFDDSEALFRAGDAVYLNAQASYRISPALQIYLRGENLTDDRTPEVFSFGARGAAVFAGCGWSCDILLVPRHASESWHPWVRSDATPDAALDPSFRWGDGIGEIVTTLGSYAHVSQEQTPIHQRVTP